MAHEHAATTTIHSETGHRLYYMTWVWLLILTGVEVFLAYEQLSVHLMIVLLMGISIVKAALIIAHFMHLRFEKLNLVFTLVPMMVITISLLAAFFPDSFRLNELGVR